MIRDEHVPVRTRIEVFETRAGDPQPTKTRARRYDEAPRKVGEDVPNAGFVEIRERHRGQMHEDQRAVKRTAKS